jgi:hypothetical protein
MTSKIQLRRDTASGWAAANPTLAIGEPGIESDTHRIKVGDGITPWVSLPYAALDASTYITSYQLVLAPTAPVNPTLGMVWIQTLS